MKNNKKAFTLVELLAVIVVLGLVLVITVPKVTQTINNSKKRTLELTARTIAKSAEEKYIENDTFGLEEEITCESISGISNNDYSSCVITFDEEGNASVSIKGNGRYKGLYVCSGSKNNSTVIEKECNEENENAGSNDISNISLPEKGRTDDGIITDTWDQVKIAIDNGLYINRYQVGDSLSLIIGDDIINMQISSINGDNVISDDDVGAHITWISKEVYTVQRMQMSSSTVCSNTGGWTNSKMRSYLNDTILPTLPDVVKNNIISVTKYSHSFDPNETNQETSDKLWIPSYREVGFTGTDYETIGPIYSGLFNTNDSRIKSGASDKWYLRTADTNQYYYKLVYSNGSINSHSSDNYGVVIGFCM